MEIRTLNDINTNELLSVLNESFSDYFVPLQLTMEKLSAKIKSDKVDLNYSVGAFSDNKLAGFMLHGFDIIENIKFIYNAGTGVLPHHRKQGLTRQMHDFILPILKKANIDTLLLEVITQNIPAIRSYEKLGYKAMRKLNCYKGEITATGNDQVQIREIREYDWERLMKFWDFTPTWQNSASVAETVKDSNKSYGAYLNDELAGYIIFNPFSNKVLQFGVDKKYRRRKIASTLFDHVKEPGTNLIVINVEESSISANDFLMAIGLKNFAEQLEMKLSLK